MVIYIDVLLFVNLIINYLLLCMTALVLRRERSRLRLCLAAVLGSAMSLSILLPALPFAAALLLKLSGAAAMCRVAFRYRGLRPLVRETVFLFFAAAVVAGAAAAAEQGAAELVACNNLSVYLGVSPLALVACAALCYVVLSLWELLFTRPRAQTRPGEFTVIYGGKSVRASLIKDSGSSLCEPLSGRPVVVLDRRLAPRLLCEREFDAVAKGTLDAEAMRAAGALFIPYTSVGGRGSLAGFAGAAVEQRAGEGDKTTVDGLVLAFSEVENADGIIPAFALEG